MVDPKWRNFPYDLKTMTWCCVFINFTPQRNNTTSASTFQSTIVRNIPCNGVARNKLTLLSNVQAGYFILSIFLIIIIFQLRNTQCCALDLGEPPFWCVCLRNPRCSDLSELLVCAQALDDAHVTRCRMVSKHSAFCLCSERAIHTTAI